MSSHEGQGGAKVAQKGTKSNTSGAQERSLVAQVAPRDPLEEPRGTQDDPMATQRGAQRTNMTQDGAKGGEKMGLVRSCESFKIY